MNQHLKEYLLAISAACLLYTVVMTMIPEGSIRKIAELVSGMMVILATLSPLVELDTSSISSAISQYTLRTDYVQREIEFGSRELMCQVIRKKCETYILDKAENMGVQLSVEVYLDDQAEVPYPTRVLLRGNWTIDEQAALRRCIAEDLGVPEDRQEWVWM